MTWSDWHPIDHATQHFEAAVYEIRLLAAAGTPVPVPRFLGVDSRGLLTIGETRSMEDRRRQFVTGITKCHGHSEGNLFWYLKQHSPLAKCHPGHHMEYRFRSEKDKSAAKFAEARLIRAYIREYGEVPPLNSAIPDRYGDWESYEVAK